MKRTLALLVVILLTMAGAACESWMSPSAPSKAPVVTLFTTDTPSIKVGATVNLRWDVDGNATTEVRIDPFVGNGLPLNGNTSLPLTSTTTFTLNARTPSGAAAQRTLTIIVSP
jgi:hypothetical protein